VSVRVFIEGPLFKILFIEVMDLVPKVVHVAVSKTLKMDHFRHIF